LLFARASNLKKIGAETLTSSSEHPAESDLPLTKKTFYGRLPFYYGWVILFGGIVGTLASIPGQTMGVSVFTDHLISALKVSRVGISSAYMVGTLGSALLIPYAGKLFDRFGAKAASVISALFLGLFLMLLSVSGSINHTISTALTISPALSGTMLAVICFFGMRFFGQGVLTLASRGMVVLWFDSRRGIAAGILGVATAFGFSYAPRPLQALIDKFGWQGALLVLGGFLILLFIPFALLSFRNSPASCGLAMEEGLAPRKKTARGNKHAGNTASSYTLSQARHDSRFWLLTLILFFWAMYNTALTFHVISVFSTAGFSASDALKIFLPVSIISVISQFIGSWLSDRINLKYLVIVKTLAMLLSGIAVFRLGTTGSVPLLIASMGAAGGLFSILNIVSWPKLFGTAHVGAISGFSMAFVVAGSAVGPWLFSLAFSFSEDYRIVGLAGAAFCVFILLLTLFWKDNNSYNCS
jgi:MFS transporter, OFA family, oxalate/formate antiporter